MTAEIKYLSYWQSCYISISNHVWESLTDKRKFKIKDTINHKNCIINEGNYSKFILHPKFIDKYIDQITDKDVINMILSDVSVSDHIKIYFKMRENV